MFPRQGLRGQQYTHHTRLLPRLARIESTTYAVIIQRGIRGQEPTHGAPKRLSCTNTSQLALTLKPASSCCTERNVRRRLGVHNTVLMARPATMVVMGNSISSKNLLLAAVV